MGFIFSSAGVEQTVKHTLDRHGREAPQFGVSEMPNGILAQLRIALHGFWRTTMSCVLLKPLVNERAKAQPTRKSAGTVLLDCFAKRIGCLLSGFEAAFRNLDSVPRRRAASKNE
jgi:hypothetical protein